MAKPRDFGAELEARLSALPTGERRALASFVHMAVIVSYTNGMRDAALKRVRDAYLRRDGARPRKKRA